MAEIERLTRTDTAFEAVIRAAEVNTLLPDARPDEIVFPRTEAEVAAIVRESAASGRSISVRSGGHSWAATSLRAGGTLIDLGGLDGVRIDAPALAARVGPGVRGGELAAALVTAGVAFPVGHCSAPGVGGYLLGGGLGLNWGAWRPAASSVTALRIVTASGDVVTASADENPDWFWLARGAGPAFPGIVTEFSLALRPLPPDIRVSSWSYDLDDVAAVGTWLTEASHHLTPGVEVPVVLAGPGRPGAGPRDPSHTVGVSAIAYARSRTAAVRDLAPLGGGADAVALSSSSFVAAQFDELHVAVDETYPDGARYLADTFWTDRGIAEVIALLAPAVRAAPSGRSYVLLSMPAHGAGATLVDERETALSLHDRTVITVYAIWDDPADDDTNAAWLDEVDRVLAPITTGHFLNEADIRRRPDRVAASFTPTAWTRVTDLRRRFDPDGRFATFPIAASSSD